MIKESEFKKTHVQFQVFHIGLSGFNFLYTLAVFNSCTDNVSESLDWGNNKSLYINLFSTIVMVGFTIGTLFTAYLISRFGRRLSMIYCDILYIIGSVILVMPHTAAFGIGRAITSMAGGMSITAASVFALEICPISLIPVVIPITTILGGIGMLCAYSFSLFLPYENFSTDPNNRLWIFLFLFPAAICAYQWAYFVFFLKMDSPQFYLSKNMVAEAHLAVQLTHNQNGMASGLRRLNSDIKGKSMGKVRLTLWGMIRQKKFRKMFRVGFLLSILQQICGTTAITFYSTLIFKSLSSGLFMSRVVTMLLGLVNLLGSICNRFFIKKFGRKQLLISSMIFLAADLILLGIFSQYVKSHIAVPAVFLISYNFFYSYGLHSTYVLYLSEVINDQIYGITTTFRYIVGIMVSAIFPVAVSGVGLGNTLFFFAACMVLGSFYAHFDLVETKGKEKEIILIEMKVIEQHTVVPNAEIQEDNSIVEENSELNDKGIVKGDHDSFNSTFHAAFTPK